MQASLTQEEKLLYEKNWDGISSEKPLLTAAKDDGIAEGEKIGMVKERMEIARKAKLKGLSNTEIADITGLSPEDIDKIS